MKGEVGVPGGPSLSLNISCSPRPLNLPKLELSLILHRAPPSLSVHPGHTPDTEPTSTDQPGAAVLTQGSAGTVKRVQGGETPCTQISQTSLGHLRRWDAGRLHPLSGPSD